MLYFYIIAAIALVPLLDAVPFINIFGEGYSWWLAPVLAIAFFLIMLILHCGILGLYIISINMNKPPRGSARFFRHYLASTIKMFYAFAGVKLYCSGEDKIPEDTRVMLVCNHKNIIDPVLILGAFPDLELAFIGKKEIFEKSPFVGKAMHRLHSLPIDRENNREAAKTIIKAVKLIKDDVASVGVFPEGYTNKTENLLLPMRSGVFKIAERSAVPIVVCTVYNSPAILKNMFRKRSKVYLEVAAVLSREELQGLDTAAVSDRVSEIMTESLQNTIQRIEAAKK